MRQKQEQQEAQKQAQEEAKKSAADKKKAETKTAFESEYQKILNEYLVWVKGGVNYASSFYPTSWCDSQWSYYSAQAIKDCKNKRKNEFEAALKKLKAKYATEANGHWGETDFAQSENTVLASYNNMNINTLNSMGISFMPENMHTHSNTTHSNTNTDTNTNGNHSNTNNSNPPPQGNSSSSSGSGSGSSSGSGGSGTDKGGNQISEFCQSHSDALMCQSLDVQMPEDLSEADGGLAKAIGDLKNQSVRKIKYVYKNLVSTSGECPAPITVQFWGKTLTFKYDALCEVLRRVSGMVKAIFAFITLIFVVSNIR